MKERMLNLLRRIPRGKVTTYGELARALGNPGLARAVGNWLHSNTKPKDFPCYKVVKCDGRVGGYALGVKKKIELLERDGIKVEKGEVDLGRRLFRF